MEKNKKFGNKIPRNMRNFFIYRREFNREHRAICKSCGIVYEDNKITDSNVDAANCNNCDVVLPLPTKYRIESLRKKWFENIIYTFNESEEWKCLEDFEWDDSVDCWLQDINNWDHWFSVDIDWNIVETEFTEIYYIDNQYEFELVGKCKFKTKTHQHEFYFVLQETPVEHHRRFYFMVELYPDLDGFLYKEVDWITSQKYDFGNWLEYEIQSSSFFNNYRHFAGFEED